MTQTIRNETQRMGSDHLGTGLIHPNPQNFKGSNFQIGKCRKMEEALSVCTSSNHRQPFSYHAKITDFECFCVLSVCL